MGTILSTTPPALKASPKVPVESKAGDREQKSVTRGKISSTTPPALKALPQVLRK